VTSDYLPLLFEKVTRPIVREGAAVLMMLLVS